MQFFKNTSLKCCVTISSLGLSSPALAQDAINWDALKAPVVDSIGGFALLAVAVVTALIAVGAMFWAGRLIFSGRWDGGFVARLATAAMICLLVSAGTFSALYV